MSSVSALLCNLVLLYILAIFLRIILSWFPVAFDSPVAVVDEAGGIVGEIDRELIMRAMTS